MKVHIARRPAVLLQLLAYKVFPILIRNIDMHLLASRDFLHDSRRFSGTVWYLPGKEMPSGRGQLNQVPRWGAHSGGNV